MLRICIKILKSFKNVSDSICSLHIQLLHPSFSTASACKIHKILQVSPFRNAPFLAKGTFTACKIAKSILNICRFARLSLCFLLNYCIALSRIIHTAKKFRELFPIAWAYLFLCRLYALLLLHKGCKKTAADAAVFLSSSSAGLAPVGIHRVSGNSAVGFLHKLFELILKARILARTVNRATFRSLGLII